MYSALSTLGVVNKDENNNDVLSTQGLLPDGTAWCLSEQGFRNVQTGVDKNSEPIYTKDQYWVILRWSGDAPIPQFPTEIEITWRSDSEPQTDYPEGIVKFA